MIEALWIPALTLPLALMLDQRLGEPSRLHPLVGFGYLAQHLEARLNGDAASRVHGVLATAVLLLPPVLLAFAIDHLLRPLPWLQGAFGAMVLYAALGLRSLHEHARPVAEALARGDRESARRQAACLVSRDRETLDPAPATVESVLENGHDAVFGALFWFLLLGPAGAVLFRLSNTLDAMWGYRTARFVRFGWAAARLDDVLGYLPARLTAASYALAGQTRTALSCWRTQAPHWKSPNAGPVMAAGAGALGLRLGGAARYQGQWQQRPPLGEGKPAQGEDIERALKLVRRCAWGWAALALLLSVTGMLAHA